MSADLKEHVYQCSILDSQVKRMKQWGYCALFLLIATVFMSTGHAEAGDQDDTRFLNVKRWKGIITLTITDSLATHRAWEAGHEERELSSERTYRFRLQTGDGGKTPVDPFVADKGPAAGARTEKDDMMYGRDTTKMQQAMKRSGIDPAMIGKIMGEMNKMKGLHISPNKYKQWSDTSFSSNVTGTWNSTDITRGEATDATGERCSYMRARSISGVYVGSGGLSIVVNLQKQAYSFKWSVTEKEPQTASEIFRSTDSCEKSQQRNRKISYERLHDTEMKPVLFEPLSTFGSMLSGRKSFHEKLKDGKERKTILRWTFVPADCEELEADIFYKGMSVKDKEIEVVVGEKVELEAELVCSEGKGYEWMVPGKIVGNYTASTQQGTVDPMEDDELKKKKISFYWWDEGLHKVKLEVQTKDGIKTATTKFFVRKPHIKLTVSTPPGKAVITKECETGYKVSEGRRYCEGFEYHLLGYVPSRLAHVITFTRSEIPKGFAGETNFIQMITKSEGIRHRGAPAADTMTCYEIHKDDILDTAYPYNDEPNAMVVSDNPFVKMRPDEDLFMSLAHDFEMYLMYKPHKPDAIFVPIKMVAWNWEVKAKRVTGRDRTGEVTDFALSGNRKAFAVINPIDFPKWKSVYGSGGTVWGTAMGSGACGNE